VGTIIPALNYGNPGGSIVPNSLWTDILYEHLVSDDPRLNYGGYGKVLFKYDPDTDGQTKAALWVEDNFTDKHNDMWT
jgi:hypothetical protein